MLGNWCGFSGQLQAISIESLSQQRAPTLKKQLSSTRVWERHKHGAKHRPGQAPGGLLLRLGVQRSDVDAIVFGCVREPRVEEMPPIRQKYREAVSSFLPRAVHACESGSSPARRRHTQQAPRIRAEDDYTVAAPRTANQGAGHLTYALWRITR